MKQLEEAGGLKSKDSPQAAATIGQLLQSFPGDMDPQFRDDMVKFFCEMFFALDGLRCVASPLLIQYRVY